MLGVLLAGCSALAPADDPAPLVRGPLASRAHQPVASTILALRPRRAEVLDAGQLRLDSRLVYASIEEVGADPGKTFVAFDGEIGRASLGVRYGVGGSSDIEVEFGLLYSDSGFLDDFVESWHDFFQLPGGGRGQRENGQHDMRIVQDGETIYELDRGRLGLVDVPIVLTRQLLGEEHGDLFVAVRGGVELPVGSEERGYGNGAFDVGGGFLAERSLGRWTFFGNADLVLPGQPDAFEDADVELAERVSFGFGGELRWSDRTSVLAQTLWVSPITRDLEPEEINREIFDLGVGLAHDTSSRSRWTLSFHEDLVAATGSDFKVQLSWVWTR